MLNNDESLIRKLNQTKVPSLANLADIQKIIVNFNKNVVEFMANISIENQGAFNSFCVKNEQNFLNTKFNL